MNGQQVRDILAEHIEPASIERLRELILALGSSNEPPEVPPVEAIDVVRAVALAHIRHIVEIKNPDGSPSRRRPRANQVEWHRSWKGRPVAVVLCFEDMLRLFEP